MINYKMVLNCIIISLFGHDPLVLQGETIFINVPLSADYYCLHQEKRQLLLVDKIFLGENSFLYKDSYVGFKEQSQTRDCYI